MTRTRALWVGAGAIALGALLFLLMRPEAAQPPADAPASTAGEPGSTSAGRNASPGASPAKPGPIAAPAPKELSRASGVFFKSTWGSGKDQFGRAKAEESNPEAPFVISVDSQGKVYVLDQVNGRILRFDKNGQPLPPIPISQQAPRDMVVSSVGTLLVMDNLMESSVAVLNPDGKLLGELPLTGKNLEDKGIATGVFADSTGTYVEKSHGVAVRVGDAAGTVDPNRPLLDGRPSRDGSSLLTLGLIQALAGRFWVRSLDRTSGQMKWMREYMVATPIMELNFLDSDISGRIYVGVHVGRELPINPADGGYGQGWADESVQLVCLDPLGNVLNVLSLPPNTMAEESIRDLAVQDDGTILYMHRSQEGLEILRYMCG